jgi:hypothetical protein
MTKAGTGGYAESESVFQSPQDAAPPNPPGDYKLFGWEAPEQFAYFDSDFVQRFESQAKPVHITESGKLTVEVNVIP